MEYQKMILLPIEKYNHLISNSKEGHLLINPKNKRKINPKPKIINHEGPPKKKIKSDWIKI